MILIFLPQSDYFLLWQPIVPQRDMAFYVIHILWSSNKIIGMNEPEPKNFIFYLLCIWRYHVRNLNIFKGYFFPTFAVSEKMHHSHQTSIDGKLIICSIKANETNFLEVLHKFLTKKKFLWKCTKCVWLIEWKKSRAK